MTNKSSYLTAAILLFGLPALAHAATRTETYDVDPNQAVYGESQSYKSKDGTGSAEAAAAAVKSLKENASKAAKEICETHKKSDETLTDWKAILEMENQSMASQGTVKKSTWVEQYSDGYRLGVTVYIDKVECTFKSIDIEIPPVIEKDAALKNEIKQMVDDAMNSYLARSNDEPRGLEEPKGLIPDAEYQPRAIDNSISAVSSSESAEPKPSRNRAARRR